MSCEYDWLEEIPPPAIYRRLEDRIAVLYSDLQAEQAENTRLRADLAYAQDVISTLGTEIESWRMVERALIDERDFEKHLRQEQEVKIERLRFESEENMRELALAREDLRLSQHRYDRALGRLDLVFGPAVFKVVSEGEEYI